MDSFLDDAAPPSCCAETAFDRRIWDELQAARDSPDWEFFLAVYVPLS